jgi:hypothetical protein
MVPEGAGRCQKVPEGAKRCQKVPEGARRCVWRFFEYHSSDGWNSGSGGTDQFSQSNASFLHTHLKRLGQRFLRVVAGSVGDLFCGYH